MYTNETDVPVLKEHEGVEERTLHQGKCLMCHQKHAITDTHFCVFLADSMERGKTACCGASARSVAMRAVFIGMFIVTAVCLTLTILMFTKETHKGNKRHTPGTGS